jgi:hypothetical protein
VADQNDPTNPLVALKHSKVEGIATVPESTAVHLREVGWRDAAKSEQPEPSMSPTGVDPAPNNRK